MYLMSSNYPVTAPEALIHVASIVLQLTCSELRAQHFNVITT